MSAASSLIPSGSMSWSHRFRHASEKYPRLYSVAVSLLGGNSSLSCNQLKGLCNEMGFFHGLLGKATTDSPGQESDWLTINNAGLAKYLIIVFAIRCSGPLGHSLVGGARPL